MILGAVLAGGEARRFGSDKALATWRGKPLIAHVVDALQPHVDALVICGRHHMQLPSLPDRPKPGLGPLGGLNAALHHAERSGYAFVLTAPCDTPVIDTGAFLALLRQGASAYVYKLPVMGVWRSADAALLESHLEESDDRSMRAWIDRSGAARIDIDAPPNINRVDDLLQLDRSPPAIR